MAAVIPRPNQIIELTRGLSLPLPALDREHLEVIAEVIDEAWQHLLENHASTLTAGSEPEISALLATRLNALLEMHPLWQALVRSITRGSETLSFDGSHLEKKPDLSIHLSGRNPSFPLIVECKLVDSTSQKGIDLYCIKGLTRFLIGEYAWPAREGFMLAYVRDGSTITGSLSPYLVKSQAGGSGSFAIEQMPTSMTIASLDSAESKHSRAFKYIAADPAFENPGAISLWHLWVSIS